jgi:Dolichyl-phosphate-mannose-protein mannosyltransferase
MRSTRPVRQPSRALGTLRPLLNWSSNRHRKIHLALFALALAPRVFYLAAARSPFDNYNWTLAGSLLTDGSLSIGGVKTTAFEPLYPLFLALCRALVADRSWAVQLIQCTLGAVGAPLLYRLAASLTGRERVGLIGAALYAVYPLSIRYGGNISDATLMSVLVLGFVYAFATADTVSRAAGAGFCLGLMMMTRMMTLPLLPIGAVLLGRDRGGRAAAAFVSAAIVIIAPYGARNYALNGWMLPTRSGLNLFISNCEYTAKVLPDFAPDILEDYAQTVLARRAPLVDPPSPLQERAADQAYTRLAIEHVAAHPIGALRLKLQNVWYFFSPLLVPRQDPAVAAVFHIDDEGHARIENGARRPIVDRVVYTLSYAPIAALALAGIWIRRRQLRQDAILWVVVATFAGVHAVYFPTTRYRLPIEFVILFYSAVAIERSSARRETSRSRNFGSDTNQPANAVFGTVPSTSVTRCTISDAMRNRIASPAPVFGASIRIASDSLGRN